MKHKNIGGSFDEFLEEDGILEQTEEVAIKRVVAFQLQEAMKKSNMSKKTLARKMNTSRSSVQRLLDPNNDALTFKTLKKAADILGKRLEIRLV